MGRGRARKWLVGAGVLGAAALVGLALKPWAMYREHRLLSIREHRLLSTIRAANRVVLHVGVPAYGEPVMRDIVITDPADVGRLKAALEGLHHVPEAPLWEKCFEGWKHRAPKGEWPCVVYQAPGGRSAKIWLPLGDCQVWPDGLPGGWGAACEIVREVEALEARHPAMTPPAPSHP